MDHYGIFHPTHKEIKIPVGNIRAEPTTDSYIIEKKSNGETLSVLGKDGQWFLVELAENRFGWAFETLFGDVPASGKRNMAAPNGADDFQPAANPAMITDASRKIEVSVDVGRIRKAPSSNAMVMYKVVKGNHLVLIEEHDDWYRVGLGRGKTGWAHKSLF